MNWSILNAQGLEVRRVTALTHTVQVPEGGWCARYEPPAFDPTTQTCKPVWPVPHLQDRVEFMVTDKVLTSEQQAALLRRAVAAAHAQIDTAAGRARSRHITVVPGQEATYILKEQQSRGYIAALKSDNPPANASAWPLVAVEAAATGTSPEAAALAVISQAEVWMPLNAQIEQLRIGAKRAVESMSELTQIRSTCAAACAALATI
ncbi:hypothetical protein ACLBKS_08105 [Hylemonella sp. W303a]|uniref:hypothetical protein n=1 Tax=Hylemonella sp. W303a TaxID=3389873 RepID=UPI00396B30A6